MNTISRKLRAVFAARRAAAMARFPERYTDEEHAFMKTDEMVVLVEEGRAASPKAVIVRARLKS